MNLTHTEYTVVMDKSLSELAARVNRLLLGNWECQGGLTVSDGWYYQAMTKTSKRY